MADKNGPDDVDQPTRRAPKPPPHRRMANREVIEQVERGYRMPQPPVCPDQIYEMMIKCWDKMPDRRPTFEHLYHFFDDYFVSIQPNYVPPSMD